MQGWRENQSRSIQVWFAVLVQPTSGTGAWWWPALCKRLWAESSFGQNSKPAAFNQESGFSLVSDRLETHLVHNEL